MNLAVVQFISICRKRGGVLVEENLTSRIFSIMKKLKDESLPVKVMSFFNELPVKVKMRVIDIDDERRVIGWEGNSKLNYAIDETKRIYFQVFDPKYGEMRVLNADVIYYSNDYIETTFPRFAIEPKLNRKFLRVTTSDKFPVKMRIKGDFNRVYDVIDISEGGFAFISSPGSFKLRDMLEIKLMLLDSRISASCQVVSVSPYGKSLERFGVEFLAIDDKGRKLINKYVLKRQKEIISKIKLLNEENL